MDILNVNDRAFSDNSLVNVEKHSHVPYNSTAFENNDEIRITIPQTQIFTLPSMSYIYIEGKLLKDNGTVSTTAKFVNNYFNHLFSEIRLEISGKTVDRIRNPGITTTLKGYTSFNRNDVNCLKNAGWNIDNSDCLVDVNNSATGEFNLCVPLNSILGFAEDFKKIIINLRQELILIRSNSDHNAIYNTTANEINKIKINKIMWKMPHMSVDDIKKLKLLQYIESGNELEIAFRSWELVEYPLLQKTKTHTWNVKSSTQLEKPRFVIVEFQTDCKNNFNKNSSKFDHCNLKNVKLYLNSEMYPYDNLNIDYSKNQFSMLYEMYMNFQESYYDHKNEPLLNPTEFKNIAPLIVIDCSRQNEILNSGTIEVKLDFETSVDIPDNTSAFCLILHDRILNYTPLSGIIRDV